MYYKVENIPDEQTMQAVVAELLPLVPFARREQALRFVHLHGWYCCLRAWQLLHSLLIEHGFIPAGLPLADLTYTVDSYGKPSLTCPLQDNQSSIHQPSIARRAHFSISHTKTALAVAIDWQPVGIDVETVASPRRIEEPLFLNRTMSAAEQTVICNAADPCLAFTELWTRKEALVKAIGTGLNLDTLPDLLQTDHPFTFLSGHTDIYAWSVAIQK